MASNVQSIGNLSVIIGGDAKALDKMLAGAQSSITGFAAKVGQIAGGIGLVKVVEAVGSALVDNVKKGLDTASSLAKLSESSGEAIDQVSKLSYAMTIATGSNDGLAKSLQSLASGIADVATGKITDASSAINAMDLNVRNTDGTLKNSAQLLGEIAAKFSAYKDGASKAALAQALFGVGGESMIPLLNKGSEGIKALGDEAEKFGLVLDGPTKDAVQSINTNLAKLDATKNGLAVTIAGKLAPAFAAITGAMLNLKTNSNLVEIASNVMAGAMKYVATVGLTVVTVFGRVTSSIADLFTAAKQLTKGDFGGAWQTITNSAGKSVDAAMSLKKEVDGLWDGVIKNAPAAAGAIKKIEAPIAGAADAVKSALDLYLDSSAKKQAAMIAEAATVGLTADQQARARVEEEAGAIAKAKNIKLTDDYRQRITDAGNAAAAAAMKLQGANVTQEMLTAEELRNQKMAQYATLLSNAAISQDTFNRASIKTQFPNFAAAAGAARDFALQIDQLATNAMNSLASSLAQVIAGTKSAAEAFQQFAIQVITQLVEMIIKAILFRTIMSAIGFSGGGVVGADTGFSLTGTGGLYDEGGYTGAGGRLQPAGIVHKGEVVFSQADVAAWGGVSSVERLRTSRMIPGFSGGGAVASAPAVTAPVSAASGDRRVLDAMKGIEPKNFYTGEMVISLMEKISFWQRQGYKLA